MADRIHEIICAAAKEELILRRLDGHEALGRPFEFTVEMYCSDANLQPADFLGTPLAVSVLSSESGKKRFFHGLIASFCYVGNTGREFVYRAVLRPWLWFLTRTTDCRIFQNLDAKAILGKVFKDKNAFSDFDTKNLKGTYRTWEYCVQYRESDFDFASRLMEQEGIYYYFEHSQSKHVLMLCDSPTSHSPVEGDAIIPFRVLGEGQTEAERIAGWIRTDTVQSTKFQYRDFDFEKPKANIEARSNVSRTHKLATFEQYDYPGEYKLTADGNRYVKIRAEEIASQYSVAEGTAKTYRLAAGAKFTLKDFPSESTPRALDNIEYLVTSTEIGIVSGEAGFLASSNQNLFEVSFTAIDAKQAYRAPQVTPRPRIAGPQTAIVVGKTGEEIWTDEYGRVKVQFHWDREGKTDENSSCWIRVAQLWAGNTWGGLHIPRIGQEVVVEFLEGDPDRPLITGRVYNGAQMPPYTLPANATQSGIKSRSSKNGVAANFNELRFEDKKDAEQVYFHAEKDFDRVVENNDTLKVGFEKKLDGDQRIEIFNNRSLKVGAGATNCKVGSETIDIFNDQTIKIGDPAASGSSQTIEVYKDRTETVKTGNETVTIEMGNRDVKINKGNESLTVGMGNRDTKINMGNDTLTLGKGNLTINVNMGEVTVKAMKSIKLVVGGSSITIDPGKITLQAPTINVLGNSMVHIKSPLTNVKGEGTLILNGGLVKIN